MVLFGREREVPEGVVERPEELPAEVEKGGVQRPAQQFTAQVKIGGQKVISTPQTQAVSIQIPADQGKLKFWAKGPITSALTWLARFFLRMIKKNASN